MATGTKEEAAGSSADFGRELWPALSDETSETITIAGSDMKLLTPSGTFPLTPASRVCMAAIDTHGSRLLRGIGADWGCGGGCLGIAACMVSPEISKIFCLDIQMENVELAQINAKENGIEDDRIVCFVANSFAPTSPDAYTIFAAATPLDFIIANPPGDHDPGGDSFRLLWLAAAGRFRGCGIAQT